MSLYLLVPLYLSESVFVSALSVSLSVPVSLCLSLFQSTADSVVPCWTVYARSPVASNHFCDKIEFPTPVLHLQPRAAPPTFSRDQLLITSDTAVVVVTVW